jgi:hypothetical protein
METTAPNTTRSIDVTGLPEEAIRTLETLINLLRSRAVPPDQEAPHLGGTQRFSSREEWMAAIREWAESHPRTPSEADWSRESIYEGRGE